MKKLFLLIATVAFATGVFAQAGTTDKKMDSKPAMSTDKKMTHCYAMKDGAMLHCWGKDGHEAMTSDATLKNGTKVSTSGEVTMKDGKKTQLKNGQCILANGKIEDFDKAHAAMMGTK